MHQIEFWIRQHHSYDHTYQTISRSAIQVERLAYEATMIVKQIAIKENPQNFPYSFQTTFLLIFKKMKSNQMTPELTRCKI